MPYKVEDPPVDKVKGLSKLSKKLQKMWVEVWNSCYKDLRKNQSEETCYAQAWGAVRRQQARDKKKKKVANVLYLLALTEQKA